MLAGVDTLTPAEIADRMSQLRLEHRELDVSIERMACTSLDDEITIKRMKKRKLQLKDCIARLESMLIPDEPA
jgi:hypothetical protein